MNFEESETKKNLETALQGEALAHLKYLAQYVSIR